MNPAFWLATREGKISESCILFSYPSGQNEVNSAFSLATRAVKIKWILRSDWLPERARWSESYILIGYPNGQDKLIFGTARKSSLFGHILKPLLNKIVWSRRLYIGSFVFAFLLTSTLSEVSVNKNANKNFADIHPSILTSRMVNNEIVRICPKYNKYNVKEMIDENHCATSVRSSQTEITNHNTAAKQSC